VFENNDDPVEERIRLPDLICSESSNIDDFIKEIYPNLSNVENFVEEFGSTAILAPRNDDVSEINQKMLDMYRPEEQATTYLSADSISADSSSDDQLHVTSTFIKKKKFRLKFFVFVFAVMNIKSFYLF